MIEAGVGFSGALASAYRRAVRLGLPLVGTDLVLWSTLVRVSLFGPVGPDLRHPALRAARRGCGELDDPEPPQRSRLAPGFDEDIARLAEAELREAAYRGADWARARARALRSGRRPPLPAYTPAVRHAVYEALHEGGRAGLHHVGPAHLTVGLLSVPDAAAVRVLALTAGSPAGPGTRLYEEVRRAARRLPVTPHSTAADDLAFLRMVEPHRAPGATEPLRMALIRLVTEVALRRPYRRHGARYGHPMLLLVEQRAIQVAVRAGADVVTGAHVLVAVLAMHDELVRDGRPVRLDIRRWNQAGEILDRHRATAAAAVCALADLPPDDDERWLDGLPNKGWRQPKALVAAPAHGRSELTALRGASLAAYRRGDPYAGTTHLLVELLADPAGPAARLLRLLDVDPAGVRADARGCLTED